MSSEEIFNFKRIDQRLATGGQPSEQQLAAIAAEGCEAVLNIAPEDPRYSLPDEAVSVAANGMEYWHRPVAWENPTEEDFCAFVERMDAWAGKNLLVHCAANYRVSAFYSLYAMLRLDWDVDQADALIAARWNPADYPPWPDFIASMRAAIFAGRIV